MTLVSYRLLWELIEEHPYLSGLMTKQFHAYLLEVTRRGSLLDDVPNNELQKPPTDTDREFMDNF